MKAMEGSPVSRPDAQVERDIRHELSGMPGLDPAGISVSVHAGNAQLSGVTSSLQEKAAAEIAAKRVRGVTDLVNDIEVRIPAGRARPDRELASSARAALRCQLPLQWPRVRVLVHQGRITLEGELDCFSQRQAAEVAVATLQGVVSISNLIQLKHQPVSPEVQGRVEQAFQRLFRPRTGRVAVIIQGSVVILRGTVGSLQERDAAACTAWSALGVTLVRNEIAVAS
jgi:osmotically-inducible protein OsmY